VTGLFDDVVSTPPRNHAELLRVIRGVRRRWRLKVALRGAAIVLGFGLLAFGIAAFALDHFRYSPWAIATFRILAYAAVIALVARYLAIPLLTRLGDERVALYVEEHDPNLQAALLSAVAWDPERVERERPDLSPALAGRLLEEVIDRCETIDYGRAVEGRSLQRFTGAFAAVALAGMMAVLLSPAFIRQAAPFLLIPWGFGAGETPYQIAATPGDAQLARGSDQMIVAKLLGFDSEAVEISVRRGAQGVWERGPMSLAADDASYSHMLLDVDEASDYFVEASGVRSPVYRLDVVDVPYVDRIDLEYHFPAHTGLSSRTIEDGGDIAALAGTEVRLSVTPTVAVPAGRLQLEASEPSDLELHESGLLVGSLTVAAEGFYRIELQMPDGTIQTASPDYRIEVLSDQPPAVRFLKPGRDARVSSIEEVFTEVHAEDDFGIASVDLVYSVNGGPDQELPLHSGPRARRSLSVGHTFFLEEEELEPGDFISYFARARDNGSPRALTTTTDIFFMEIRPFGKIYRQAGQMGGGGGGGGGDGSTLSHQQRQIVAATFRLVRDVSTLDAAERAQDVTTLALLQGRLRDQVSNLHGRILGRGILDAGEEFQGTGDSLESAIDEMTASEAKLLAGRPDEALGPEQRALKYLQRAEAAFREVQVAFGGGPGGGGGQMAAEDLADLFDLELDKLENQYETVRRRQQAQADEQVDEALQRLQELARRQQQENERQRQLRGRLPNQGGGGGGGRQRELAEQAEELGRQLERLARQQRSPTLSDTARRLRDASDAMRRSRTAQADDRLAEGIAALDRLRDARQALERGRSGRLERDLEDALGSMEGLQRAQARIAEEVRAIGDEKGERLERLLERKDQLADGVEALEAQLDRMSREVRRSKQEASRRLQGASDTIRETKLKEKIRYSKGFVQARPGPDAESFEAEIRGDLDQVAERLGEVEAALGPSEGERATASLERTRDLVRRLESLTERLEERAQGGAEGAPGDQQNGEPQAGEEGQGGTGPAGGGTGRLGAEGVRQIRSELRERRSDLRELERELERAGQAPGGLREIDDRLGGLDNLSAYRDPRGVAELAAAVLEDLKLFEYALSRQIEGADPKQLRLSDTDELPPGWRQLVEEYYRSLAREP